MLFSFEGRPQRREKSGGDSKEETPVPMPNTEVKVFSVDDTWWETARESRELPELYGPLVKRLRHRPFTAVSGVRFPHGSLYSFKNYNESCNF